MPNATKATKTITADGSKGMLVLEPGVYFQRKTNLPANWTTVRLGVLLSFTNTTQLNGTPVAETIAYQASPKFGTVFGLSNGVGFPGEAGNQFVGAIDRNSSLGGPQMQFSSPNWRVKASGDSSSQLWYPFISNGTSVNSSNSFIAAMVIPFGDPTAATSCLFALAFELKVNGAALEVKQANSGTSNLSSASDSTLANFLTSAAYSSAVSYNTGSFWNGTSTFPGAQYFAIRSPFVTNRLRILNMMVINASL